MEFLEKHGRTVIIIFAGLLILGLAMTFASTYTKHKEEVAQEKLAQIEFDYSKYKEELTKSHMPTPPVNLKDKTTAPKTDPAAEAAAKAIILRASLLTQLNQFISTEKDKTIASRIAALYLSELYLDDGKNTEALTALKNTDSSGKDLTSVLVQKKIGSLLADSNQCDEALKVWGNIIELPVAKFAQPEIKIMQSLCYQKKNDLKKAEELLLSVKNDKSDNAVEFARHAERILRLIQFKKASGS